MLYLAANTLEGKFYQADRVGAGSVIERFRLLRIAGNYIVSLSGVTWILGDRHVASQVGLSWAEIPFSALAENEKKYVIENYKQYCLQEVCVCDSLALFHAGCQCGHLKAIREKKKAS